MRVGCTPRPSSQLLLVASQRGQAACRQGCRTPRAPGIPGYKAPGRKALPAGEHLQAWGLQTRGHLSTVAAGVTYPCTSSHFYPWADPLDSQAVLGGYVLSRMHGTGDGGSATPCLHPSQHPAGGVHASRPTSRQPWPDTSVPGHPTKTCLLPEPRAPPPRCRARSGSPAAATTTRPQVSAKHWASGACSSGASRGTCQSSWRGWHPELPLKQLGPRPAPHSPEETSRSSRHV